MTAEALKLPECDGCVLTAVETCGGEAGLKNRSRHVRLTCPDSSETAQKHTLARTERRLVCQKSQQRYVSHYTEAGPPEPGQ